MLDWLQIAFAGLWPLVWHYGIGVGIAILALAFAWFSPVFKRDALWVAFGAIIITATYGIGVSNGMARVQAQWDAALDAESRQGEKARTDAERTIGPVPSDRWVLRSDPFNRNSGTERECK